MFQNVSEVRQVHLKLWLSAKTNERKLRKAKLRVKLFLCYQLEYFCSSLESAHHARNQIKPKMEYDLSLMVAGIICFYVLCLLKWKCAPALMIIIGNKQKTPNHTMLPFEENELGEQIEEYALM